MAEKIIVELFIAIIISIIIYKYFLKPKESNRGIIRQIKDKKTIAGPNDKITERIKLLIEKGNILPAIKIVREITGMGLKEAKEYVDSVKKGAPPSIKIQPVIKLEDSIDQEIITLLKEGKKIEAIKLVRLKSKVGLKEAKDFIESFKLS